MNDNALYQDSEPWSLGENWEEPYKVKTTFLERTYYLVDLEGKVIFQV